MGDESAKRAAQEYQLSKEGQSYEEKAPAVWRKVANTIITKCRETEHEKDVILQVEGYSTPRRWRCSSDAQ